MRHLDLSEIIAYVDPAQDERERERTGAHLAKCLFCRSRLISLSSFRSTLSDLPESLEPFELTEDCVPVELMGDFLGGRLPGEQSAEYSAHVERCDMCFERAAYFSRESVRMAEGVLQMDPTPARYLAAVLPAREETAPARQTPGTPVLEVIRRWLASPLPAYAFAAGLLFFMIVWGRGAPSDIADLNSNDLFTLYEAPPLSGPSFGFSDSGRKVGSAEAGLSVERTASGNLRFGWKEVSGAAEYVFSLQEIGPGAAVEIANAKTASTETLVDGALLSPGKAYRWKVAGSTAADRVFIAVGQFTLLN